MNRIDRSDRSIARSIEPTDCHCGEPQTCDRAFVFSDKTGTLTRNEMMAATLATTGRVHKMTGEGYAPVGTLDIDGAGALLIQSDGAAPFLNLANCSNVTISNFTLAAARAPYTSTMDGSTAQCQCRRCSVMGGILGKVAARAVEASAAIHLRSAPGM